MATATKAIPNPLEGVKLPNPDKVYSLLAKQIIEGSQRGAPKIEDLAEALAEIEYETQITGASFLKIEVIDPEWEILTSGLVDVVSEEGSGLPQRLQPIEIEYPGNSGYKWILCAVETTTDPSQPQILTFEDTAVQALRERYGPKVTRGGQSTYPEFAGQLLEEAGVKPVIPSRYEPQPVASSEEGELGEAIISTNIEAAEAERRQNKSPGVSAGTGITIKGLAPTTQQLHDINTALSIADQEDAGEVATLALLIAGIAESGFDRNAKNEEATQTDEGIWQSDQIPGYEVARQAEEFLKGGESFGAGGAIAKAKEGKSPGEIAKEVEVAQPEPSWYEKYLPEARAMLAGYGGVGTQGKKPGGKQVESESAGTIVHRGTKENPSETSFECLQRLARETDWYFFTKNEFGYFMDGYDLIRQEPVLYVNIPQNYVRTRSGEIQRGVLAIPTTGDFDNTTYYYQLGKKLSSGPEKRAERKSALAVPESPSEIQLCLICEETEYEAGDVFQFEGSGPYNGRWVITDAVRQCMSEPFTTFTLQPPRQPLPEPKRTKQEEEEAGELGLSREGATKEKAPVGSGKTGVVEAAKKALSEKAKYVWREERPMPNSLFGAVPRIMDCSAFATLCYKAAGEPDPNGLGYNREGYTGTLWAHGKLTTKPEPGDLCFYGSAPVPEHVTVYIGGGQVISMGELGDPSQGGAAAMGPAAICGYRTYG